MDHVQEAITPAQQLRNVAAALVELVDGPAHPHRMDAIRSTARQLAELIDQYLNGTLAPIPDDDLPF